MGRTINKSCSFLGPVASAHYTLHALLIHRPLYLAYCHYKRSWMGRPSSDSGCFYASLQLPPGDFLFERAKLAEKGKGWSSFALFRPLAPDQVPPIPLSAVKDWGKFWRLWFCMNNSEFLVYCYPSIVEITTSKVKNFLYSRNREIVSVTFTATEPPTGKARSWMLLHKEYAMLLIIYVLDGENLKFNKFFLKKLVTKNK